MRPIHSRLTLVVVLFGAALVTAALAGCAKDDPLQGKVELTEVRATDLEKAIKDQKGKVILVDCWATWCAPCVKTFPNLVQRHKKYADKGLVCMSVSMDKLGKPDAYDKDAVLKFLTDKKATFTNFIVSEPEKDEEKLLKLLGDYSLIPYMAIFDRNGRRIWGSDDLPKLTDAQIDKKIEELLADKP